MTLSGTQQRVYGTLLTLCQYVITITGCKIITLTLPVSADLYSNPEECNVTLTASLIATTPPEEQYYAYGLCESNIVAGKIVDPDGVFTGLVPGDKVRCIKYVISGGITTIEDQFRAVITSIGLGYVQTSELVKTPTTGWIYYINYVCYNKPEYSKYTWYLDYPSMGELNNPPVSPSIGDKYLVGYAPTGSWIGKKEHYAEWNGSSWIFTTPIIDTGKVTTSWFIPYIDNEPTETFITLDSYNIYVKSANIYSTGLKKYVDKANVPCVQFTGQLQSFYTSGCCHGSVINGMICGSCRIFESNASGIFSITFSTEYEANSIHIKSYDIDYWIKVGWAPLTSSPEGVVDGNLFFYRSGVPAAFWVNALVIGNDLSATSLFSKYTRTILGFCCVFEGMIVNTAGSLVLLPGSDVFYIGAIIEIRDLNGVVDTTLSNLLRCRSLCQGWGTGLVPIVFEGELYCFATVENSYVKLTSLTDRAGDYVYHPSTGVWYVINDHVTSFTSYGSFEVRTVCVHNGKLYALCSEMYLLVFNGIDEFINTGIPVSYGKGSLVSYGGYLVIISNSADNQFIPAIDIIPNSMLPL